MNCCEHPAFEHDGNGDCTRPGCDCKGGEAMDLSSTPTNPGPSGEESYDDPEGSDG